MTASTPTTDSEALLQSDSALRKEADELLRGKGLLRLLESYGKPHVHGSYSLGTMVWRDLDLYLENAVITEKGFFELGGRLASLLSPTKMNYRDTRTVPVEGLPLGLYWGVYQVHRSEDAWKIDIWATDSEQCKRQRGPTLPLDRYARRDQGPGLVWPVDRVCRSAAWAGGPTRWRSDRPEAKLPRSLRSVSVTASFTRRASMLERSRHLWSTGPERTSARVCSILRLGSRMGQYLRNPRLVDHLFSPTLTPEGN